MKTNETYNRRHRMKKNKTKIQLRKLTRCTDPTQKPWGGQEDPTKNPGMDKSCLYVYIWKSG
jgi:hypothetical protein